MNTESFAAVPHTEIVMAVICLSIAGNKLEFPCIILVMKQLFIVCTANLVNDSVLQVKQFISRFIRLSKIVSKYGNITLF